MASYPISSRRRFQDQVFVWDRKFETRRRHDHEGLKLLKSEGQDSIITFSKQYHYAALRDFLDRAKEDDLQGGSTNSQHDELNILLDDRRDDTGWEVAGTRQWARDWSSYAGGYPPEGQGVVTIMINARDLYRRQLRSGCLRIHLLWRPQSS